MTLTEAASKHEYMFVS